ncbi:MAG: thiamine diphosphokinase [Clostridiaceae bacterium]|nr:thiamine diphosphokinase [Clostridiaceae bacterium]
MNKPVCCIFGAFPPDEPVNIPPDAFVIAADGGYRTLLKLHRCPDLSVGDFDSLGYEPAGPVVRHPVEKDDTDMLLAVREGLRREFTTFLLYGGVGGRLDHTLANLQTLLFIRRHQAHGFLIGGGITATVITDETIRFRKPRPGTLSVFAIDGNAQGVTLEGLFYPLSDYTVKTSFPIGVSNSFTDTDACVSVRGGSLLVLWDSAACRIEDFIS